jgi:hypothetical protein
LEEKSMDTVGLVDVHHGQGHRPLGIGHRLPDLHVVDARDGHDVALGGLGHLHALEALVAVEHGHLGDLRRLVAMDDGHAIVLADLAVDHASDDEAAHVVVPVQGGGAKLEPQVGVEAGRWNGGDQGVEEGGEGLGVVVEAKLGDALARVGVEHGELELVFRRVEIDEEVVDLVEHLGSARVLAVDLVDDDHGGESRLQRLLEHEARLGQGAFRRVHEEEHPVHESEGAFHLAPEVGVAGRVHDIDLHVLVVDGRVLRHDRDALLALEVDGIHDPLHHVLVGAEDARLPQHGVDEGRLAVVDVGDDGDVPYVFTLFHVSTVARIFRMAQCVDLARSRRAGHNGRLPPLRGGALT